MIVSLVQSLLTIKEIPACVGAKLLDINRTSRYFKGNKVLEELTCKEIIDYLSTENPTWDASKARGCLVGRSKVHRHMNEMDIFPIYSKTWVPVSLQ